MIVHAGLLALRCAGRWRGVLIEGPSGSGKSELALRAMQQDFRLVADDRVRLWTSAGRLFGRAPAALHGLIEVRGQGVLPAPALDFCEIGLVVRSGEPDRLPDPQTTEIAGIRLPVVELALREASAPAKLRRAAERL